MARVRARELPYMDISRSNSEGGSGIFLTPSNGTEMTYAPSATPRLNGQSSKDTSIVRERKLHDPRSSYSIQPGPANAAGEGRRRQLDHHGTDGAESEAASVSPGAASSSPPAPTKTTTATNKTKKKRPSVSSTSSLHTLTLACLMRHRQREGGHSCARGTANNNNSKC